MALLRCSVMSSIGGSQLVSLTITDGQSTNYAAPPADTRRVVHLRSCELRRIKCLHVLSSFQRTGGRSPCDTDRLEGNLTILLNLLGLVNPGLPSRVPPSISARGVSSREGSLRKRPADRAEPTHYTIRLTRCQPRAATFRQRTCSVTIARPARYASRSAASYTRTRTGA